MKDIKSIFKNQLGQGLIEYGFIITLVALVVLGSLYLFSEDLSSYYQSNIINKLP